MDSQSDFLQVSDFEIGPNSFKDVWNCVKNLAHHWKQFATVLGLHQDTIYIIQSNNPGDSCSCLHKVLDYWLKKGYDVEQHGHPSWRIVCVAVKDGGQNTALADEIARKYPMPATVASSPQTSDEQAMSPGSSTDTCSLDKTDLTPTPDVLHVLTETSTASKHLVSTSASTAAPLTSDEQSTCIPPGSTECLDETDTPSPIPEAYLTEETASKHLVPTNDSTAASLTSDEQAISPTGSSSISRETDIDLMASQQIYVDDLPRAGRNFSMWDEIYKLRTQFDNIYHETRDCLQSQRLSDIVDYIENHFASLLGLTQKREQELEDKIHCIQTIQELFNTLRKYVSWFNFKFIAKLAQVFLRDNVKLKRKWTTYGKKLKDYFINNEGRAVECVDAVQFGLSNIPGTKVMIAKVDHDKYTLGDLYFFQKAIPKALNVPNISFYFCDISTGCLHFNYSIPDFLYSILFPLRHEQLCSLAALGIIEVICGEFAQKTNNEFPLLLQELSDSNIDICDPLWYENTSTPLHEACWRGLKNEVKWLIEKFGYKSFHQGMKGWSPILAASYGGHIDILQQLIEKYQCDPTQGDDDSVTSLHMASYKGHLDIVQYLLDTCHLEPDVADNSNNTALFYSALGGHCDVVTFFLEKKCNPSHINMLGASLSTLACKSGQLPLVRKLEELSLFSADSVDCFNSGVLHYAVTNDSVELVDYLLTRYKIPLSLKDRYGRTPLHIASWFASSAVVEYIVGITGKEALLEEDNGGFSSLHRVCDATMGVYAGSVHGKIYAQSDTPWLTDMTGTVVRKGFSFLKCKKRARLLSSLLKFCPDFNINATTTSGLSLLNLACHTGNTLLVKTLKATNIIAISFDHSPVHDAAMSGSPSLLSYVIPEYQLNANKRDGIGATPLADACDSGSIIVVEYLITNHQSDPHVTDVIGRTSLHRSCRGGHIDLTQHLIEVYGSDIKKLDGIGRNLVHLAAESGSLELVQYLINEHGLSPTVVDRTGCTALHYAARTLKLPLVKKLVETYGLDPNQPDRKGKLPTHYAAHAGDVLLLDYLGSKCNLSHTDNEGWNIIHYSAIRGHAQFIKHTITQHPHCLGLLQAADNKGHLPVHLACKAIDDVAPFDDFAVVIFVTSHPELRSTISAKTADGSNVLHLCCSSNSFRIFKHLVENCLDQLDLCAVNESGMAPIHLACEKGTLNLVECIIEHSPHSLNLRDSYSYTPLLTAVYHNHLDVVRYLNSQKCEIAVLDGKGNNVLHISARKGHLKIIRYFIEDGYSNPEVTDYHERTSLHIAAMHGQLEIVEYLLDSPVYVQIDPPDKDGNSPLHLACEHSQQKIVTLLATASLSHNLNLLETNKKGQTPLHSAAAGGHVDTADALLSADSSISNRFLIATDNEDHTALYIACTNGHYLMYCYLCRKYPGNVNAMDKRRRGLLHAGCEGNSLKIVKSLVEKYQFDPESKDKDGVTCLHLVAERGNIGIYQFLRHHVETNPFPQDNMGRTPLHYACLSNHFLMVQYLMDNFSCHPNDADLNGFTSVHAACQAGSWELVHYFLMELECDALAETNDSKGLLYFASQSSNLELVRYLVEVLNLKPRPQDIEAAKSMKADSDIVKFLIVT